MSSSGSGGRDERSKRRFPISHRRGSCIGGVRIGAGGCQQTIVFAQRSDDGAAHSGHKTRHSDSTQRLRRHVDTLFSYPTAAAVINGGA